MGFFDSLGAEKYDRTYEDRDLARRIVGYFKPQKKRLVLISLLTLLVAGAGARLPVIVSRGIDLLGGLPKVLSLVLVAGAVLLVGVGIWLFNFGLRRLTSTAIAEVVAQLSSDAYKASVEHDLSFYDEFSSGKIVSRITSDTRDFGELVTLITDVASMFIESLILAVVLLNIQWQLSMYVFAIIPLVLVLGIDIQYMYAFTFGRGGRAVMIFRFDDPDTAITELQARGVNPIQGIDLYERA